MVVCGMHHLFLPIGAFDLLLPSAVQDFILSFQLAYESRKTKRIIASRDISYAFTNVMANYYYSLRGSSYNNGAASVLTLRVCRII
jgi:hypothetical protein